MNVYETVKEQVKEANLKNFWSDDLSDEKKNALLEIVDYIFSLKKDEIVDSEMLAKKFSLCEIEVFDLILNLHGLLIIKHKVIGMVFDVVNQDFVLSKNDAYEILLGKEYIAPNGKSLTLKDLSVQFKKII